MQSFLFEAFLRLACLSVWNVLSHNGSILIASPKELNHICRATRTIGNHINNLSPCKQPSPQRLCQSGNLTLGNQNFQLSRFFSGVATSWLNCKFCHHLASLTTNSGGLGMSYNRHMVLYLSICMSCHGYQGLLINIAHAWFTVNPIISVKNLHWSPMISNKEESRIHPIIKIRTWVKKNHYLGNA